MSYQNISYVMPADHLAEIKSAITLINQRMPFLVNLNPEERRTMLKHADRDTEFVADASFVVNNFPDIFPVAFGVPEYQRDVELHRILGDTKILLESLAEKIRNTELALGNEVMRSTNQAYHLIQAAKKSTPGIQKVAEKMALRYKGQGKKKVIPEGETTT
jgi:hypothetical protein